MLPTKKKTDLRILRTRHAIESAFSALMVEKGMEAISVQDIAKRAMVNRATFYAHYSDKYDLFRVVIRKTFLDYLSEHFSTDLPFDRAGLEILTTAVFTYMGTLNSNCSKPQKDAYRPLVESQVQTQLNELIQSWLAQQETDVISGDPKIVASLISWIIFGAGLQWNRKESGVTQEAVVEEVMRFLACSLVDSG